MNPLNSYVPDKNRQLYNLCFIFLMYELHYNCIHFSSLVVVFTRDVLFVYDMVVGYKNNIYKPGDKVFLTHSVDHRKHLTYGCKYYRKEKTCNICMVVSIIHVGMMTTAYVGFVSKNIEQM